MSQLATLGDVAAIGGVPVDVDEESPEAARATRLIELASAEILAFYDGFGFAESDIEGWEEFRLEALAAITAEIANKRLNVSGAPSVDPYSYGSPAAPQTMKLNRWEKQALRDLLPAGEDGEMPWMVP